MIYLIIKYVCMYILLSSKWHRFILGLSQPVVRRQIDSAERLVTGVFSAERVQNHPDKLHKFPTFLTRAIPWQMTWDVLPLRKEGPEPPDRKERFFPWSPIVDNMSYDHMVRWQLWPSRIMYSGELWHATGGHWALQFGAPRSLVHILKWLPYPFHEWGDLRWPPSRTPWQIVRAPKEQVWPEHVSQRPDPGGRLGGISWKNNTGFARSVVAAACCFLAWTPGRWLFGECTTSWSGASPPTSAPRLRWLGYRGLRGGSFQERVRLVDDSLFFCRLMQVESVLRFFLHFRRLVWACFTRTICLGTCVWFIFAKAMTECLSRPTVNQNGQKHSMKHCRSAPCGLGSVCVGLRI